MKRSPATTLTRPWRCFEMASSTPYWAQVGLIRSLVWGEGGRRAVEVSTVDGFQGKEKRGWRRGLPGRDVENQRERDQTDLIKILLCHPPFF